MFPLNLGVPFYGYEFQENTTGIAKTYAAAVESNPCNADCDQVGSFYYNGRPTIHSKTLLAAAQVGGIMIWELGQDRFDAYSLLSTIHSTYVSAGVTTTDACNP